MPRAGSAATTYGSAAEARTLWPTRSAKLGRLSLAAGRLSLATAGGSATAVLASGVAVSVVEVVVEFSSGLRLRDMVKILPVDMSGIPWPLLRIVALCNFSRNRRTAGLRAIDTRRAAENIVSSRCNIAQSAETLVFRQVA